MLSRFISKTIPLMVILLVAACSGPFVLIPGGAVDGELAPTPSDWAFTDAISTVQIETNPSDPYSVNTWALGMGPSLYLQAGANRATWVDHLDANPNIRVRIEGRLYELASSRVTEEAEFATFADAYEVKYGRRPRNEEVSEVYLLRLSAR